MKTARWGVVYEEDRDNTAVEEPADPSVFALAQMVFTR
jgi:hypothetical protein